MGAHLNLVFSFFIITTFFICVASPSPTPPPPSKCSSPPPPTPPPPPTFHHQESRKYAFIIFFMALGVNSVAVFLLHQTQEVNQQVVPDPQAPIVNPQEIQQVQAVPNQHARERAKEKLKLTVLKFFNLVSTLFFFLVTMHLQSKYKNPTTGEVAETLMYSIFAFVILSGIVKSYWDFGHVDFIMTMLSNYLIYAIKKNYRMLYVIALGFILLFFALDGYYNFLRRLYNRCKACIQTIRNQH